MAEWRGIGLIGASRFGEGVLRLSYWDLEPIGDEPSCENYVATEQCDAAVDVLNVSAEDNKRNRARDCGFY